MEHKGRWNTIWKGFAESFLTEVEAFGQNKSQQSVQAFMLYLSMLTTWWRWIRSQSLKRGWSMSV
jgi:hypothetical protein